MFVCDVYIYQNNLYKVVLSSEQVVTLNLLKSHRVPYGHPWPHIEKELEL